MNTIDTTTHLDVAALRDAFDRSFEQAPEPNIVFEDFLSVPTGPARWMIRMADVAGLFAGRTITAVPSARGAVLGLASIGGGIRPVFDLALLLGAPAAHAPRWLITAAAAPIAFAFEQFSGHLRLPAAAVEPAAGAADRRHVCGWVNGPARTPILDVRSVIDHVRRIGAGPVER